MYIQTKLQDRTYIQKTLQDRTYIQTGVDTNVIGNGVKCPSRICSNSYRKNVANSEKPIALGRDIGHKGFVETEKEADENPKNWWLAVHLARPAHNHTFLE